MKTNYKKLAIGIDVGGTNTKISLVSQNGKIVRSKVVSTPRGKTDLIASLEKEIINIRAKNNIIGVGIGMPGPIDNVRGIVHYLPNIPGWKEVELKKILEKKTRFKVFVDNDVNLMTLAEFKFGAAKKAKNSVCITLGTGVGGGIIVEGKLYYGSSLTAGEIGHMPVNLNGPKCACGGRACLESYVGNRHILQMAKVYFGKNITLEKLSLLANSGNKKAKFIWNSVAEYLAVALTQIINFFNPDIIVIGGGVAQAKEVLFAPLKRIVCSRAMRIPRDNVRIVKAKLGQDAGMIGAGALVFENIEGV